MKQSHLKQLECGPVLLGQTSSKSIRVWGKLPKEGYMVVLANNEIHVSERGIFCSILLDTPKQYSVGWVETEEEIGLLLPNHFENSSLYTITSSKSLDFVVGSCRKNVRMLGLNLFGTGNSGHRIFDSVRNLDPNFVLSIGDNVYLDAIPWTRAKTEKEMISVYKRNWNFQSFRSLCGVVPMYFICDDHDRHKNNTNYEMRHEDSQTFNNALSVYNLFQHYSAPCTPSDNHLFYSFEHTNAHFFMMDTRSYRNKFIDDMLGPEQLEAFEQWIFEMIPNNAVKFVISPTPMVSDPNSDTWFGFPESQKRVIDLILKCENIFILTGDAHCARSGVYNVHFRKLGNTDELSEQSEQNQGEYIGTVVEIMSSGWLSLFSKQGKRLPIDFKSSDIEVYNKYNAFPFMNENVYTFTTVQCTETYPQHPIHLWNKFKCRGVFTRIYTEDSVLKSEIRNVDGDVLAVSEFVLFK